MEKVYIAVRFKGADQNKDHIEQLGAAVRAAGMQDFCFVRDVEHYQHVYDDLKLLWRDTLSEMKKCDSLLIDVTDQPSGGRVVELGIAYALGMSIYVVTKPNTPRKGFYDGIATKIIEYNNYSDITNVLMDL